MSTIKNLQVKTNLNTSCDLLIVGAQDGVTKFPSMDCVSTLSRKSISNALSGEKKIGSEKRELLFIMIIRLNVLLCTDLLRIQI